MKLKQRDKSNKTSKLERLWKLKNNELFDIGCKIDEFEGDEKSFYEDQSTEQVGRLDLLDLLTFVLFDSQAVQVHFS